MNKKWIVSLIVCIALLGGSVPAAAQSDQPIQVYLEDGSQVSFETAPVLEEGTTLVQLRPIFEKLGLTVSWDEDTRTVTGSTYNKEIKLQIGNTKASVNGTEKELSVAPRIVHDTTLVPLRFIAEASGQEVGWNGYEQAVLIAPLEKQLAWVVGKNIASTNKEDINGVLSTIDQESPAYEGTKQQLMQTFPVLDFKGELKQAKLLEAKGDQASLETVTENLILRGSATTSHTLVTAVQLLKRTDGQWKVFQSAPRKVDYLNTDRYKDEKPQVSSSDEQAVLAALEKMRSYSEKEDLDGIASMYDPDYPNLKEEIESQRQLFAQVDFAITIENPKIIQAKGNEVTIRYNGTALKKAGPVGFPNVKVEAVEIWKKNDKGEWKFTYQELLTKEYI